MSKDLNMSRVCELSISCGLSEQDLSKAVSDKDLERISRSCCKDWKSLPTHLELETFLVEDIEKSWADEREKRHNFLRQWKRIKGSRATYRQLVSALLEIGSVEDAEKVCAILKESGHWSGERSKIVASCYSYACYCDCSSMLF